MSEEKKKDESIWVAITGILFVILPITVLAIVRFYQGTTFWGLLSSPEWSFGSAILFGRSITNFISAVVKHTGGMVVERLVFLVTVVVVLGLVPSLVILSLILIEPTPQSWLVILQILLFIVSCFIFVLAESLKSDN